jgi:hypothetical protein
MKKKAKKKAAKRKPMTVWVVVNKLGHRVDMWWRKSHAEENRKALDEYLPGQAPHRVVRFVESP